MNNLEGFSVGFILGMLTSAILICIGIAVQLARKPEGK